MTPNASVTPNYQDRLELISTARHKAIDNLFGSSAFPLTSLMGPMNDGPEWPSDASWLALNHAGNACIISDGLSDPWIEPDRSVTGLELEVFVETPDISAPEEEALMSLTDRWLFPMTAEISHTLASYPRLCQKLLAGEPLSLRFNIDHVKDGRGLLGVLLHKPQKLPGLMLVPGGQIQLIAATLLTPTELSWLVGKGLEGRQQLMRELYKAGVDHRSVLNRSSVVSV